LNCPEIPDSCPGVKFVFVIDVTRNQLGGVALPGIAFQCCLVISEDSPNIRVANEHQDIRHVSRRAKQQEVGYLLSRLIGMKSRYYFKILFFDNDVVQKIVDFFALKSEANEISASLCQERHRQLP
jgi:hypothetical protein